jgi:hypothetical protein
MAWQPAIGASATCPIYVARITLPKWSDVPIACGVAREHTGGVDVLEALLCCSAFDGDSGST